MRGARPPCWRRASYTSSLCFTRRARTASASECNTSSVASHPMHASVIDTPYWSGVARNEVLASRIQVAFDHDAEDAIVAGGDLRADVARDVDLAFVPALAVGVRAVDHELRREPGRGELLACRGDARRVVVRRLAAAQDDVAILVAGSVHDRRVAALGHRQEMMRRGRGLDRVDGDLDVAVGAVLEADRAREPRRELAVHLALGGARADRAPRDEIREVLRRDHVEILGAGRQIELVDLEKNAPREAQAVVDPVAVVEVRVVDQPLPAHRRARLLEIDAHHDDEIRGELAPLPPKGASRSRSPRRSHGSSTARRRRAGDRRRRAVPDEWRAAHRTSSPQRLRRPETPAADAPVARVP